MFRLAVFLGLLAILSTAQAMQSPPTDLLALHVLHAQDSGDGQQDSDGKGAGDGKDGQPAPEPDCD